MSTVDWPTELQPATMEWGRVFNSYAFTSPFTQSQQIRTHPGAYWKCSLTFRNLKRPKERVLSTFIGSLHGMAGTFKLKPWTRPPGPFVGNAVVDGGGQAGAQVVTRNWNANTLVLRRGDYITITDQLLEVLADVTSNAQGIAVVPVSPWLRVPPANGATVNYRAPYAIMRLARDDVSLSIQALIAGGTLECREAF
ncbi:hypothetical protein HME01_23030 [Vreelandella aquamarina]|uniref:Uncharacterized protein n=1 Tax=Vreelandella aquamarina TaxID=77097 RepID=A0A1N6D749_9GAMM|nr:hypothetical protein [Halomonas meridiana]GED46451.1 hypothetical protein HME01_23030 [Halomonas meridiana]SIN66631.1 hypothetical protein SAMN05878249_2173 [Halomonas meridiana]SIN79720.1 hypothetical protein SAMN05878438_3609 [Halomonas meridiana]SIO33801.1 hypothetical protein SAMN05878442_2434 [Halomonas meridiana]